VRRALARFQARHGLEPSGRLDRPTLEALNEPVEERLAQIEINMERWRWLPHDPGTRYVLVRIADFELDLVEEGKSALAMRVIVGKPYWRTPVFSALMTHLVLNPYWYIPQSIAAEEILPLLRRDPSYLGQRRISVAEGEGVAVRPIEPDSIDWNRVQAEDFPYYLAQAPGPDNPLGRVKFMFPNAFNVYLHDTPNRALFAQEVRAFSHGCIRLEKSLELAVQVLRREGGWSLERLEQEVEKGINRQIVLEHPLPVYLLYWTAWVDAAGQVQFREDLYEDDQRLKEALRLGEG
jgi:murein L,D-transpeptidase YcbB/YkuD